MAFPADNFSDLSIDEGSRSDDFGEALIEREKKEMAEGDEEGFSFVLPSEIIRHIVSFLDCDALNKMRLVSGVWNDICRSLLEKKLLNLVWKANAYYEELAGGSDSSDNWSYTKSSAALCVKICVSELFSALGVRFEGEEGFDAGRLIEDASRLLDRAKSGEELPDSFEELIPPSFLLFKTFCEQHVRINHFFIFDYLKHSMSERSLRRNADPV